MVYWNWCQTFYALKIIRNVTRSLVNWKKEFLHRCISKILFIDAVRLSKMQISLQEFFKNFVDRFQNSYQSKNWIVWRVFLKDFVDRFWNFYNKNNSFEGTLTKNIEKLPFKYFLFIIIWKLNRGNIADSPLLRTLSAICQMSLEPSLWEVMSFFVSLAYVRLAASRTLS